MAGLITQLNARTITSNDQVLAFIVSQTGQTIAQLDASYRTFALAQ